MNLSHKKTDDKGKMKRTLLSDNRRFINLSHNKFSLVPLPISKMKVTQEKHVINWYTYMTVLTVDLLTYSVGMGLSWSSPVLIKLTNAVDSPFGFAITTEQASWIAAVGSLGGIFGPVPFGYLTNKFGRKWVLMGMGSVTVMSFLMMAFGETVVLYYIAKFIGGCSGSGIFALVGVYKSEIAHHKDRAILNSIGVVMMTLGVLTPYVIGPYLPVGVFNLICAIAPAVSCVLFPFFMCETPPYLISVGKHEQAHETLTKLRTETPEAIEKELAEMQTYVLEQEKKGTLLDLFRSKVLLKCLGIAVFLISAQHFVGVSQLISYTQEIFEAAGTGLSSDVSSIIAVGVQLVFSCGTPFIIRRFKFRTLLTASGICLTISLTFMGLYYYLQERTEVDTSALSWMPIVTMNMTLFSFVFGFGVVPAIMMVEIFPTDLRSLAVTTCFMIGSVEGFVITKYYFTLANSIGHGWCFWIFAAASAVSTVIVVLFIPETNGKTFQEIHEMLRRK